MRESITARVVGQKVFQPDPKNLPDLELGRVELVIHSMAVEETRASKANLIVPKDWLWDRFVLGRMLTVTFEDLQQELDFDGTTRSSGSRRGGEDGGGIDASQTTLTIDTGDGHPVTAPFETVRKALDEVKGRRRGAKNLH